MIPDKCSFCHGRLVKGKTEFVVKVGDTVLTIKDVSAYVCEECGEAYYTPEVSRKIDKVMKKFHESKLLMHPVAAGEVSLNEVCA
ncbi:type II toxin-antitoxin system MqsA family antitoxin [Methanohalophilus portucalensis]|uniref:Type II toxin-antitoxin system MqsA family antitoxin n=2 Tax=Methanohalophilus portucalensis TaxID=39664 RepID=A0A1X7P317_9EURY|nr:type II toxin-antitoxin system MqsA family antitoxin [Methanohalophilus portucalensis]ATU08099.1 YgiT-type zinc finger domain-containing protein [Methanohalophilus portucalensis]RNI10076.1 type II toxin-antitoxin system MqsA family antitoxin [Methanohalophilus portucalensis FDF-1]SMH44318.1 YgiT-type zinc finger domain-containing protein [Methanohalophilus portucalensis FDF-1]